MIGPLLCAWLMTDPPSGFDYRADLPGGNVFVDWHPDQPDLSVAVMTRPGPAPDDSFFGYDRTRIQFIVRGPKGGQRVAFGLCEAIRDRLAGLHSVELDEGVIVVGAQALDSQPASIGTDEAGRPEYDCHMEVEVTREGGLRPLS